MPAPPATTDSLTARQDGPGLPVGRVGISVEAACCEIVHDALPRKRCWRGGRITASQSGAAMLWDIAFPANPRWYAIMLATHSATCNGISMHLQSHSEISAPKLIPSWPNLASRPGWPG